MEALGTHTFYGLTLQHLVVHLWRSRESTAKKRLNVVSARKRGGGLFKFNTTQGTHSNCVLKFPVSPVFSLSDRKISL